MLYQSPVWYKMPAPPFLASFPDTVLLWDALGAIPARCQRMRFCENFVLVSESGTSYTAIVYENRSAMFELIYFRNANIKNSSSNSHSWREDVTLPVVSGSN